MRKVVTGVLPLLLAAGGQAAASSFVAPPPAAAGPSIITLGEAEPAPVEALPADGAEQQAEAHIYVIGDSMIAMGADAIPTAKEAVAAIAEDTAPQRPGWLAEPLPLVIRGGIAGDARPVSVETTSTEDSAGILPDATPAQTIR